MLRYYVSGIRYQLSFKVGIFYFVKKEKVKFKDGINIKYSISLSNTFGLYYYLEILN